MYLQTELQKLNLRLKALENKAIPAHLEPASDIAQHSDLPRTAQYGGNVQTVQYQVKTDAQAALDTKDYGAPVSGIPGQPGQPVVAPVTVAQPGHIVNPTVPTVPNPSAPSGINPSQPVVVPQPAVVPAPVPVKVGP